MDTDIYIAEKTGNRSMRIPWIPESITFDSNGTRFAKYEILKAGEVYVPSGVNIHSYSWKSILPGRVEKTILYSAELGRIHCGTSRYGARGEITARLCICW